MKSGTALLLSLLLVMIAASPMTASQAQSSQPRSSASSAAPPAGVNTDSGWPRKIVSGEITLLFYQPQIRKWENNRIEAYAALAVQTAGSDRQTYGVVQFTARTEVDKVNRMVTLEDFHITNSEFPTAPDKASEYAAILQREQLSKVKTIALDRLLANLAAESAEHNFQGQQVKNEAPRIIFSTKPAMLVLIDGEPVLRPLAEKDLERVINTRALIVFDRKNQTYFLYVMDGWLQAPSPEGPWEYAKDPPSGVKKVKDNLGSSDQVDLMSGDEQSGAYESLNDLAKNGNLPAIYVSTVPAELIITDGEPQLKPVGGTSLLYVTNTGGQVFMDSADQNYYVLISGRWFRGRSMEGPWQYVSGAALPAEFAKIPETHEKAGVLASIPGTAAAREAEIEDAIPQTATVTRSEAALTVKYDGDPRFERIEGTNLRYAINTATPVIQVEAGSFCAVNDGVWFVASSPLGPWSVATSVPSSVYSIPTSCPLHYVTYVRVYGYTDDVAYCGYTPGYYGTVLNTDGVVVYGTGWYYPPYIGSWWIGWPWSYGCGAGFWWSPWGGWGFDFGIGFYYPFWRPWWGPLGWGWRWRLWGPRWGWGWGGIARLNVYGRWGRSAMIRTHAAWANPARETLRDRNGRPVNPRTGVAGPGRPIQPGKPETKPPALNRNNVFVGRDGKVYRYDDKTHSWQERNSHGWQQPGGGFDRGSMDRTRQGQQQGTQRSNNFPGAAPRGGAPRSGGGGGVPRGGGGGRGGGRH